MSTGVRQTARLFLEGREVPFSSVTITCNPNVPQVATIDLVPHQVIKQIRPRTQVQVFVSDTLNFADANPRLAFDGEVCGRGMGKAQDSRFFQIIAIDYSAYWDEAKAYYYNPNFIVGKAAEVVSGIDMTIEEKARFTVAKQFPVSSSVESTMITEILEASKSGDLIDGIISIIKKLSGVNLFYRLAYSRFRINDRIRFVTSGKLAEFLKELHVEEFLKSFTGKQGGMTSLREMLMTIMQLVFHEVVTVPFPSYLPVKGSTNKTIGSYIFIPDGYSLPPPKCNVVFPNQQKAIQFSDDFRAAPTRYGFRMQLPTFVSKESVLVAYPMLFYPDSVSDYMFKKLGTKSRSDKSLLGAASLFKNTAGSYSTISYSDDKSKAVGGTTLNQTLREVDFLTNDEAMRGVFFDMDTFAPSISALAPKNDDVAKTQFFEEIGRYNFFKKRFASRNCSADLLFNPNLVPGFNCVLVDDSDAGQTIIAKLQSVTHHITNKGCTTSIALGYARDFDEIDYLTGGSGEPPLPKWFDENKFGKVDKTQFDKETQYLSEQGIFDLFPNEKIVRPKINDPTIYTKLNSFYQELIGCDAITDYKQNKPSDKNKSGLVSNRGAIAWLVSSYRKKSDSPLARDKFVKEYTARPIPTLAEAMNFLGAKAVGLADGGSSPIPEEFAVFKAHDSGVRKGRFDGIGFEDELILKERRKVIDQYVELLKTRRGFRG